MSHLSWDDLQGIKSAAVEAARVVPPGAFMESLGVKDREVVARLYEDMGPATQFVPTMALGATARSTKESGRDQFQLLAHVTRPEMVEPIMRKASGAAVVRVIEVKARPTPEWLQQRKRKLRPGQGISPWDARHRGTLTLLGFDADEDYPVGLSNKHVIPGPIGEVVVQPQTSSDPRDVIGVKDMYFPIITDGRTPNELDLARFRMQGGGDFWRQHNDSAPNKIADQIKNFQRDEIGRTDCWKQGSTTGHTDLTYTGHNIDGLPIGFEAGVGIFLDMDEFTGSGRRDGSAGGDSGSGIGRGRVYGSHLNSGGHDGSVDRTFGIPMEKVQRAANFIL